ncbi:MAG: Hsp20/alpha crystallin family protein [Burkholderiales bacterium]
MKLAVKATEVTAECFFEHAKRRNQMNELRAIEPLALGSFEDVFRNLFRAWPLESPLLTGSPSIRMDISETDNNYIIKADIPGVRKEDVDIQIDNNLVTIRAELKSSKEESLAEGRYIRRERQQGYATRSLSLAIPVDESRASAKYENGILELTLPKRVGSSARRLQIR